MNEPFLLSNLIELQELDNKIFKLISEKSDGSTVKELKTHEIEFKKLQSDKQNIENESKAKIKNAIKESKDAEFPNSNDLLTDVYIKY